MNYSTYRFTLDLQKTKSQVSIPVPHTDTGVQFFINLTDGGKPYKIEEACTAVLYGKKADGTSIVHDCDLVDKIENYYTRIHYEFTDQTASVVGPVDCEIRLYKNGKHITTPSFIILVEERVLEDDDIIESEVEKSAIDRLFETENTRVDAEDEREAGEKARREAEAARAYAEELRAAAETNRFHTEESVKKFTEDTIQAYLEEQNIPNTLAGKVTKIDATDASRYVYTEVHNAKGVSETKLLKASKESTADASEPLARRRASGAVSTAREPTEDDDAASKLYVDSQIVAALATLDNLQVEIVEDTSKVTNTDVLYLISVTEEGSDETYYEQWALVNGEPVNIGNTKIDLSDYVTKGEYNGKVQAIELNISDISEALENLANSEAVNAKFTQIESSLGVINDALSTFALASEVNPKIANLEKTAEDHGARIVSIEELLDTFAKKDEVDAKFDEIDDKTTELTGGISSLLSKVLSLQTRLNILEEKADDSYVDPDAPDTLVVGGGVAAAGVLAVNGTVEENILILT